MRRRGSWSVCRASNSVVVVVVVVIVVVTVVVLVVVLVVGPGGDFDNRIPVLWAGQAFSLVV